MDERNGVASSDRLETLKRAALEASNAKCEQGFIGALQGAANSIGPSRETALAMLDGRIQRAAKAIRQLQSLREALPDTLTPELDELVYEMLSATRRYL